MGLSVHEAPTQSLSSGPCGDNPGWVVAAAAADAAAAAAELRRMRNHTTTSFKPATSYRMDAPRRTPGSSFLSPSFYLIHTNILPLIVYFYYTYHLWYFRDSFAAYCAFIHDLWPQIRSQFVSVFCLHQWFIFVYQWNLQCIDASHSVLSFIISGPQILSSVI